MLNRVLAIALAGLLMLPCTASQAAEKGPVLKSKAEIAAALGNPLVQANLAVIYTKKHDYVQAATWFSMAAEQGHALSQYSLGHLYDDGLGVKKDKKRAASWYYKAAIQGDRESQYRLGKMYLAGEGVKQSNMLAVRYLRAAATQGDERAKAQLTRIFAGNGSNAATPSMITGHDTAQDGLGTALGLIFLQGAGAAVGTEASYLALLCLL
ncbi:MAG: tetratricopeptide repeat protein [Alphaproteobacteria bacterium]